MHVHKDVLQDAAGTNAVYDSLAASRNVEPPCTGDVSMRVAVPEGCTCRVMATMDVPVGPEQVYDILTDPENRRVFRNVKRVLRRSVVENDGNKQVVDVEQLGRWKFLCFGGTFSTKLRVVQNRQAKTVKFALEEGGFMRRFDGTWRIKAKDSNLGKENEVDSKPMEGRKVGCSPQVARVDLVQELSLAVSPPASLSRMIGKITAHTARSVLLDLYEESLRIYQGRPIEDEDQAIRRPLVWKRKSPRTKRSRLREQGRPSGEMQTPA